MGAVAETERVLGRSGGGTWILGCSGGKMSGVRWRHVGLGCSGGDKGSNARPLKPQLRLIRVIYILLKDGGDAGLLARGTFGD